jgi:hypothetical protein
MQGRQSLTRMQQALQVLQDCICMVPIQYIMPPQRQGLSILLPPIGSCHPNPAATQLTGSRKPLNTGQADFFGVLPNCSARVMALARPGQVRGRRGSVLRYRRAVLLLAAGTYPQGCPDQTVLGG